MKSITTHRLDNTTHPDGLVLVYLNGLLQDDQDDYKLNGRNIEWARRLPAGSRIIAVYKRGLGRQEWVRERLDEELAPVTLLS